MLGVIIHNWNDGVGNLLSALKQATKTSNLMVPSIQKCWSLTRLKNYLILGMQLFPKADCGECASAIWFDQSLMAPSEPETLKSSWM